MNSEGIESNITDFVWVFVGYEGISQNTNPQIAVDRATNYLLRFQNPNGYWGWREENVRMVSTAQVLNAFKLVGIETENTRRAYAYLRGNAAKNNDYLSRQIITLKNNGENVKKLTNKLIAEANLTEPFGWSTKKNFLPGSIETALGIWAAKDEVEGTILSIMNNGLLSMANSFEAGADLANNLSTGFSWTHYPTLSIYVTAIANHASSEVNIDPVVFAQQINGSYAQNRIDTAAMILYFNLSSEQKNNAMNYLINKQRDDGSWDLGNSYITALCLEAIKKCMVE